MSLDEQDYKSAAALLCVDTASVKAISHVEAPGSGFLANGDPRILFERHKFSDHTGGRHDKAHPDISNPQWGGYGKESEQHSRLQRAVALDREAALMSASWGKFQILGENYKSAGFSRLQDFVNAMYESEQAHLHAFVNFILSKPKLHAALKAKNWDRVAYYYNGPAYKKNQYQLKLPAAYKLFGGK